jgi:two-component system response regulator FixJ
MVDQFALRRVYVVDDDDAVRDSTRALLESLGMDVRDYATAREFFLHLCKNPRGCVLLDLHMPGMTGLEILELLRAQGCDLPVIVVTGRGDALLKERVKRAGGAEFLEKPVDESVLMHALDRAFASSVNVQ